MSEQAMEMEVVEASAVEALNRAEIKSQVELAKQFPRSMEQFKARAIAMATIDEDTAVSCIYRRPVGKEKGGSMKYAEGMSIRMAEIVGACYGNLRVGASLIDQTERKVVARGMAIDLETNFASASEVVEATVTSEGRPYSEGMRITVAKAALAKAWRDATFKVVPRALAKPVEAAVRRLLLGEAKSMETRRQQVEGWIKTLNINDSRIFAALGVKGIADVGLKELEVLTGLRTAIKDGETTIDEAFPPIEIAMPKPKNPEPKKEEKVNAGDQSRGGNTERASDAEPVSPAGGGILPAPSESGDSRTAPQQPARPDEGERVNKDRKRAKSPEPEATKQPPQPDICAELIGWIATAPLEELTARPNLLDATFSKIPQDRQIEILKRFDQRVKGR